MQDGMQATDVTAVDAGQLVTRLDRVREVVAAAAARAGRRAGDGAIVAISNPVDRARVDPPSPAGIRHFGENRVQEAVAKFATPLPADAVLHLVGQLQTNKAKPATRLFSL